MKKYVLILFTIVMLLVLGNYCIDKNKESISDKKYKNDVYDLLELDSCDKGNEVVYVVIFDTGLDEAYAQSFYKSKYSCISNIMSYTNDSVYATESRHGTLMQQFFDEISVRAGTIDTIKTIHFKVKESDEEKISLERVVSMLEQVLKLKQDGYNIAVLNISQVFESESNITEEISQMIHILFENGIITVSASGNECDFRVKSNIFAYAEESIVVGGIDLNGKRWMEENGVGSPIDNRIDIYGYASNIYLGEKIPYFQK